MNGKKFVFQTAEKEDVTVDVHIYIYIYIQSMSTLLVVQ